MSAAHPLIEELPPALRPGLELAARWHEEQANAFEALVAQDLSSEQRSTLRMIALQHREHARALRVLAAEQAR